MKTARAEDRDPIASLWDVVEVSLGGHERRRRLGWRMTQEEAEQWQAAHGGRLDRVSESGL